MCAWFVCVGVPHWARVRVCAQSKTKESFVYMWKSTAQKLPPIRCEFLLLRATLATRLKFQRRANTAHTKPTDYTLWSKRQQQRQLQTHILYIGMSCRLSKCSVAWICLELAFTVAKGLFLCQSAVCINCVIFMRKQFVFVRFLCVLVSRLAVKYLLDRIRGGEQAEHAVFTRGFHGKISAS